jgi:small multidrug resistance pump
MNHYYLLLLAIAFEVCGTTCMKLSDGFSKLIPSILIFVFYAASFSVFTLALKQMDVSIAYAIWAGLGTALITVIGIFWFKEPVNALKIISLIVVVAGIVGLNLSDKIAFS